MSIKGFKSQQALQKQLSGYTEDQSIDQARYVTMQEMSGRRHALDVNIHGLYQISVSPKTVAAGSNIRKIVCVAHGANKNDIIRLSNGTQFATLSVPDADTIITSVELDTSPVGDTFTIWRHISPAYNADGSLNVTTSMGSSQYDRKSGGVTTSVKVLEDLDTPSNSKPFPVGIHSIDGAPINVNAGDLKVDIVHNGANASSVKIGDGSQIMAMGQQLAAASIPVILPSATIATLTPPAAIIGFALDTSVNNLLKPASTLAKVTTVDTITNPVTVNTISGFALETGGNLAAIKAKTDNIPAQGQALAATSLPVVLPSTQIAALTPPTAITGFALEAGHLATIDGKIPALGQALAAASVPVILPAATVTTLTPPAAITGFNLEATQTAMSAKLPATIGQKAMTASLAVTLASDQTAIPVNATPGIITPTITTAKITVGTTAVRATVAGTAPNAARKRLYIKPSKSNTGAIYIGASTVAVASSMEIIGPDRVQFDFDSGDYYLISDTASQSVEVMECI